MTADLPRRAYNYLRNRAIRYQPRYLAIHALSAAAYLRRQVSRRAYTHIDEAAFRASRTSDTLFIFGGGTSLHEVTPAQWAHIQRHNTFGFSLFVHQRWVRTDYYMLRELGIGGEFKKSLWYPYYSEAMRLLDANPYMQETIVALQTGWSALLGHRLLNERLLPPRYRVLPFRSAGREFKAGNYPAPTRSLAEGVAHGAGSLTDIINLGAIGGWRHIVLMGIDLYGSKYFWQTDRAQQPQETPPPPPPNTSPNRLTNPDHAKVKFQVSAPSRTKMVANLAAWRPILEARGHQLWVGNPKSRLTEVLPVYEGWD